VVRPHDEDDVRVGDEPLAEKARAVVVEVELPLDSHEHRSIRRGGPLPRARPGARGVDVVHAMLDGDLARDRRGERAAAGVAGADEEELHA
jgi:hypothetical protein